MLDWWIDGITRVRSTYDAHKGCDAQKPFQRVLTLSYVLLVLNDSAVSECEHIISNVTNHVSFQLWQVQPNLTHNVTDTFSTFNRHGM